MGFKDNWEKKSKNKTNIIKHSFKSKKGQNKWVASVVIMYTVFNIMWAMRWTMNRGDRKAISVYISQEVLLLQRLTILILRHLRVGRVHESRSLSLQVYFESPRMNLTHDLSIYLF